MKNKNITTLVIEGADGVGKTTLCNLLRKGLNFRFMIQHRGELSWFVYAKKFHRTFVATERHLPILYIFLKCSKEKLKERLVKRNDTDLSTIDDEDLFEQAAIDFDRDYNIITIDTSNLSANEVYEEAVKKINEFISNKETDDTMTLWNKQYEYACSKLGFNFAVRDNQPYINNIAFMSEANLQNGVFETFTDKSYPDNLIYSYAYDDFFLQTKKYDFAYIINSKINQRKEVFDYYKAFVKKGKTCLVSEYEKIPQHQLLVKCPKAFGNDFITMISQARATVYSARDLEYLKLQTCRLYEAILAKQIVFVDKLSDKDCDILKQIYKDKQRLIDLLYVTPETIVDNYMYIMSHRQLYLDIITIQSEWYNELCKTVKGGKF